MEEEKLVRLHDMLSKLRPGGKKGGLGFASNRGKKGTKRSDGLPNNGLYSMFVRQGEGTYQHKHWTNGMETDAEEEEIEKSVKKAKKEKKRKTKAKKVDDSKSDKEKKRRKKETRDKKKTTAEVDEHAKVEAEPKKVFKKKSKKRRYEIVKSEGNAAEIESETTDVNVDRVSKPKKDKKRKKQKLVDDFTVEARSTDDNCAQTHKRVKKFKKKSA
ncbi:hypothetical protein CCR75_002416 [Bremia lactucae]|uniref:Uncharacterized protein n=1 Tax=Bremia lactucae TaxID=4779 RepID=A0A976FHU5_BRELC|nr:hypothetical protein CCR75_002416 [Bremia lactucae]